MNFFATIFLSKIFIFISSSFSKALLNSSSSFSKFTSILIYQARGGLATNISVIQLIFAYKNQIFFDYKWHLLGLASILEKILFPSQFVIQYSSRFDGQIIQQ